MLTHLLAGLIVSGMSVGDVKVATAEEQSVDNAARLYRIQIYNSFRLDRPEFDRRHEKWVQLETAWDGADKAQRDVPALLHWLETATANSRPESIAPLPELPKIVAVHSSRRNGSAVQTIRQRLAKDKLKSVAGSAMSGKSAEKNLEIHLSTVDTAGSQSASGASTSPKATPVSSSTTLIQSQPEDAHAASETSPVPGSDATPQANHGDAAGETSTANGGLYQAYGERLGNNLGAFAAGLVRRHAELNAGHNNDGKSDGPQSPAPND